MKTRLYVPVYSLALLLSAFLLFSIQPLFGKMILPLLGGSPSVWNTAMLFFQIMLLGGYACAHATSARLDIRAQGILHVVFLAAALPLLPVAIPAGWVPSAEGDPVFWQLGLMAVAVGWPFFVVAGTAPMLQRWFSETDHPDAHNPYFLYAASNFGSMAALLGYPFVIEPFLTVHEQALYWTWGYGLLIAAIVLCAMISRPSVRDRGLEGIPEELIGWKRRGLWILLAFVPSSLMLGVTTYITTDIASVPLFWILPLALYVGTFIIVFARKPLLSYGAITGVQALFLVCVVFFTISGYKGGNFLMAGLHLGLFAFTALACHTDLARLRPGAGRLTEFYLLMSLGGALGGIFNALLAPKLFVIPAEYCLVLTLACFLRFVSFPEQDAGAAIKNMIAFSRKHGTKALIAKNLPAWVAVFLSLVNIVIKTVSLGVLGAILIPACLGALFRRRWAFGIVAASVLVLMLFRTWYLDSNILHWNRNFFGVTRIAQPYGVPMRIMTHGTTIHGAQPTIPAFELTPLTYYYPDAPAGDIFHLFDARAPGPQSIAGLGLGVGSISCYARPERHFQFYEIDPDVARIAQDPHYFTYLRKCGSPYDITLGDGRMKISLVSERSYDLIFLDVFSSDNIPVHVMTTEAFEIYKSKLKDNGMILMNISNRYLDLVPVVAAVARETGLKVMFKTTPPGEIGNTGITYSGTIYAVFAKSDDVLNPVSKLEGWSGPRSSRTVRPWSDDYADIAGAFRFSRPGIADINADINK